MEETNDENYCNRRSPDFIGGNFVHHMVNKYPDYEIINLDLLTYAGNHRNFETGRK